MQNYKITESQFRRLFESKEQDILRIPSLSIFEGSWDSMQNYLRKKGNPPYIFDGDLIISYKKLKSLGNLISVEGNFEIAFSEVESLGELKNVGGSFSVYRSKLSSLGNLESVGKNVDIEYSDINSFGNLKSVGLDLILNRKLRKKFTNEEIEKMIKIGDSIINPQ